MLFQVGWNHQVLNDIGMIFEFYHYSWLMAPLFFGLNTYSNMPGQKQALLQEVRRCRHGLPSVESEWFLETVRQWDGENWSLFNIRLGWVVRVVPPHSDFCGPAHFWIITICSVVEWYWRLFTLNSYYWDGGTTEHLREWENWPTTLKHQPLSNIKIYHGSLKLTVLPFFLSPILGSEIHHLRFNSSTLIWGCISSMHTFTEHPVSTLHNLWVCIGFNCKVLPMF